MNKDLKPELVLHQYQLHMASFSIENFEGSFAEVGQVIAGIKFNFLTPDMASKNDDRHGIGIP